MGSAVLPVFLLLAGALGLAVALLVAARLLNPSRPGRVKQMPYESGMDPIHGARRKFDVRFHLLAIAFLVFDVELLFLYPWAVTARPARLAAQTATAAEAGERTAVMDATAGALQNTELARNRRAVFFGVMVFVALLTLGFIYDWRKGIFRWR
ncbi:MAG TPA: NADH-quinone oxidoreductase subunit A [Thermoguttaceae bacterium]|nr:NADH-quinone oxidoreductase subunit A [Thermoguttaceae bacterium]